MSLSTRWTGAHFAIAGLQRQAFTSTHLRLPRAGKIVQLIPGQDLLLSGVAVQRRDEDTPSG